MRSFQWTHPLRSGLAVLGLLLGFAHAQIAPTRPTSPTAEMYAQAGFSTVALINLGALLSDSRTVVYLGNDLSQELAKVLLEQAKLGKGVLVICGQGCAAPIFAALKTLRSGVSLRSTPKSLTPMLFTDRLVALTVGASQIQYSRSSTWVDPFKKAIPGWMAQTQPY